MLAKIVMMSCLAAALSGCAVLGSDVRGLRDIKETHTKTFDKTAADCYALTTKALAKWDALIFQQGKDDHIVAMALEKVYRSCINTTELGIFFTQVAPGKTEVKVASLNYELSRFIASKLFYYIEKDGKVPDEKPDPSAVKPTGNPFK